MSPVDRSDDFVTAGYFLASCSDPSDGSPPPELSVPGWQHAYSAFYRTLGAGRPLRSFCNSLKATRDAFDGWVDSARIGWRDPRDSTRPKPLQPIEGMVFDRWRDETREALWGYLRRFVDSEVGRVPPRFWRTLRVPKILKARNGQREDDGLWSRRALNVTHLCVQRPCASTV